MPYQLYSKPCKTSADLVNDLSTKGLYICDQVKCEDFLHKVSYYRFKIYLRPFLSHPNKHFRKGYWFREGVELYRFDEAIRNYLFSVIARIEIKLRSRLDQVVTSFTNNPFWYLDDQYFAEKGSINRVRSILAGSFNTSPADYAKHYKSKYYNDTNDSFKQLPPFWMASDLTTFGNLRIIFNSLKKKEFQTGPRQNALDELAKEFGAKNLKELNNWLFVLRDVRNRCAHHSRVWNSNYRAPSSITRYLALQPSKPNRLYSIVALIHHIAKSFNLDIEVRKKIYKLTRQHPSVITQLKSAGFPTKWYFDPFWK